MAGPSGLGRHLRSALDPFLLSVIATLLVAVVLPLPDAALQVARWVSTVAVAVLFLAYGMRLRTDEVIAGLRNVRLQGSVLAFTYLLFPLVGLAISAAGRPLLGAALASGLLFTALLPSTVNSSVAFTSIGRGNVGGALTAATLSNIGGIFLTPALVLAVMGTQAHAGSITKILLQLLAPFVVGQVLGRWTGDWMRAHRKVTLTIDRGTILVGVFAAVASATAAGVWASVTGWQILALLGVCGLVLAIMLSLTWWGGRAVGMPYEDRVAFLLCGSQKSLVTGLPMGLVLFPAATAATMVVPIVIYHQLQLMVCTVIVGELGRRHPDRPEG